VLVRATLLSLGAQDEHEGSPRPAGVARPVPDVCDAAAADSVSMAVWTADGSGVLSASLDGSLRLWNLSGMAGSLERVLDGAPRRMCRQVQC
jgi:hypothetical protein